jgi:hypothetical protein
VTKRTVAEIENDFRNASTKAGYVQFQIFQLKADLALLNEQIRDLNTEGLKAQAEAKAEAAAPEVTSV